MQVAISITSVQASSVVAWLASHQVTLCRDWTQSGPAKQPCRAVPPRFSLPSLGPLAQCLPTSVSRRQSLSPYSGQAPLRKGFPQALRGTVLSGIKRGEAMYLLFFSRTGGFCAALGCSGAAVSSSLTDPLQGSLHLAT